MKKSLLLLLAISGIILISGCSLLQQKNVDNSEINQQIPALPEQVDDLSKPAQVQEPEPEPKNEILIEETKDLKTETQPVKEEQTYTTNFTEFGAILNWDAVEEKYRDNWEFSYSKPGYNAIILDIEFNKDSICDFGGGNVSCLDFINDEYNGLYVELEGYKEGSKVEIIRIKKQ